MKSPFTGGPTRIVREPAPFKYRGQTFEVAAPQYECLETKRRFTTTDQDDEFVAEVQRLYRERNFVPSTPQVQATRAQYGLSAARMAALLGFGTNQYARYEAGEIPTESNGTLIWLASQPEVFSLLVQHKARLLRPRQLEQVQHRIAQLGAARQPATLFHRPLMWASASRLRQPVAEQAPHQQATPPAAAPSPTVVLGAGAPANQPLADQAVAGEYSYAMAA